MGVGVTMKGCRLCTSHHLISNQLLPRYRKKERFGSDLQSGCLQHVQRNPSHDLVVRSTSKVFVLWEPCVCLSISTLPQGAVQGHQRVISMRTILILEEYLQS